MTIPRVYYEFVMSWRNHHASIAPVANGVFRGITSYVDGYSDIVGITKRAYAVMSERVWTGNYGKGLRRDHIKSAREFQEVLLTHPDLTYETFCALVADYGRCIVCTADENPSKKAGYGNAYKDEDVLWLAKTVSSHSSFAVPVGKKMVEVYKSAKAKEEE